jgi:DNA (cytosine-5)-methyltransferase 1
MQLSIFSSAEHPASHSASPDCERDWLTRVATSCSPILPLLTDIAPAGWCGRTSPASCLQGGGADFGALLGGLAELGYGFAYRVLDAQYFGVAQRRRRVFVVGHLGDWRRAAAVLFERHSLQGHPAPRRQAGQGVAGTFTRRSCSSIGDDDASNGHLIPSVSMCLNAGGQCRQDAESETLIPTIGGVFDVEPYTLAVRGRGESHDLEYRQDGTANALLTPNGGRCGMGVGAIVHIDVMPTMMNGANTPAGHNARSGHSKDNYIVPVAVSPAPTFAIGWSEELTAHEDCAGTMQRGGQGGRHEGVMTPAMQVRRLTPRECERLQGFPDDYTLITYRNKPAADGPRYKALGNSMAVPVMRWIGERIEQVDAL